MGRLPHHRRGVCLGLTMTISTYSTYPVRWLGSASGYSSGVRSRAYGLAVGPGGRIVYDVVDLSRAAQDFVGSIGGAVSDSDSTHSALSNRISSPTTKKDSAWRTPEFPGTISVPWTPKEAPRQDNSLIYFVGKDYSKESLRGVNFDGAAMSGANFNMSDLTGADFSYGKVDGANFDAADLGGARFDYTDVSGASFVGADLRGADLSKAIGLTATQLSYALYDTATKLPDELSNMNVTAPPIGVTSVLFA